MSTIPHLQYSIKDLERLSGIKAHTLRIWEQRYGLLNPNRSDTNIRYYSSDDLRRLLNVSVLNQKGIKISKIVQLSEKELNKKLIEITSDYSNLSVQIDGLILAMIDLNEARFEEILQLSVEEMGFEETMLQLIYPFFKKVGVLWQTGSINAAQEHFISHLVRQKIIVAIDNCNEQIRPNAKTFLLFLPEGELHEMGLLFHHFLIKKAGHKTIYLGQTVPLHDLAEIISIRKPDVLVTALLSYHNTEDIARVLQSTNDASNSLPIKVISVIPKDNIPLVFKNVSFSSSPNDFSYFL